MRTIKNYLDEFRESVSDEEWSQAVTKSRLINNLEVTKEDTNFVIFLKDPGLARAIKVKLNFEEFLYHSDCRCEEDPCVHLLSATILANTRDKIEKITDSNSRTSSSKVHYVLKQEGEDFIFFREVLFEGKIVQLKGPLSEFIGSFSSGRRKGEAPLVCGEDFLLDKYFLNSNSLKLTDSLVDELQKILVEISQIYLEKNNERKQISFNKTKDIGKVNINYNEGELIISLLNLSKKKITLIADKVFISPNLPNCLNNFKQDKQIIGFDKLEEFINDTLPQLQRHGFCEDKLNLPKLINAAVSLSFDIIKLDSGISVLPKLVYGNPEIATFKSGKLTPRDWLLLPKRNLNAELELVRFCKTNFGLTFDSQTVLSGDQVPIFYSRLKSKNISIADSPSIFNLEAVLVEESDFPEIIFQNDKTKEKISLEEVSNSYFADRHFIQRGDSWFQIPIAWLGNVKNSLERTPKESRSLSMLKLLPFVEGVKGDYLKSLITKKYNNFPNSKIFELMRPYQRFGSAWITSMRDAKLAGVLLADDMGLGKTVQVISTIENLTLVVCPTTLLNQWKSEIEKFRPEIEVLIYHGTGRKLPTFLDKPQVVITSYGVMKRDAELLSNVSWNLLVVDEAQNIKNSSSENFIKISELKAGFKVSLTGTPIENSIEDLVSILNFTVPGLLSYGMDFLEIKKVSSSFILRRTKQEVLKELPEKTEVIVSTELSEEERRLYELQLVHARKLLEEEVEGRNTVNILERILRLRQIAVDPRLAGYSLLGHSNKIIKAYELIANSISSGRKVLVFSQWTSALDLLELKLNEKLVPFSRIDGSTANRASILSSFQNDNSSSVMLLSLKAGGVGLNLTNASDVIFFNTRWNPASESQAMDRVHRIGQTNPVFVYKLISEDTIEEKILNLQNNKLQVYNDIMSGVETKSRLDMKDLVDLLN